MNQLFGVQSQLPNLMTQRQQVNDARDAEFYIARLGEFPHKLAQVMDGIKLREAKGVVPPKFTVEKVLTQIKGFTASGAVGNELTVSFKEKLSKIPPDKMDAATRAALTARVETAVKDSVLPAYAALATEFEALRSTATANNGAWSLPDGDAYYQHQIDSNTTTTMTAAQIHALGLKEVTRVGAEMDAILHGAGYTSGSRAEKIAKLNASPAQLYADSDAGRAQLLTDYQAILDEVSAGLDPYFKTQPKAKVVVKRVPAFTEVSAPGAYYQAAPLDGSAPGTFYVNLRDGVCCSHSVKVIHENTHSTRRLRSGARRRTPRIAIVARRLAGELRSGNGSGTRQHVRTTADTGRRSARERQPDRRRSGA